MSRAHVDIPKEPVAEFCRRNRIRRKVDLNTPGFLSHYFRDQVLAEAEVQYDAA